MHAVSKRFHWISDRNSRKPKTPLHCRDSKIRQLSDFDQIRMMRKLWDCPLEYLEHFKGFYISPFGEIKATPLLSVSRTDNNIQFKLDDLIANQPLVFGRMGLIMPDHYELCRGHLNDAWYAEGINLLPGVTLIGTYNIPRENY
jgi:hypothetical protein